MTTFFAKNPQRLQDFKVYFGNHTNGDIHIATVDDEFDSADCMDEWYANIHGICVGDNGCAVCPNICASLAGSPTWRLKAS